ncbi:MAG: YfcE family phosphodiesterase [Patescibacteria group bacterium]
MKIGIIADTHDNLRHLDKAIQYFNREKIGLLLHCGDWIMPFTMEMFKELKCPIKGVLGNGDPDIQKFQYQLQNKFQDLDLELSEIFLDLTVEGKRIAVFHGNDEHLIKAIVESRLYEVFCHGHTHQAKIEKRQKTLIINPGSLVGVHLPDKAAPITVAIYDTAIDKAEIVSL